MVRALENIVKDIPDADLVLAACGENFQAPRPVVITLDRRTDRWRKILLSLSRAGISDVVKFKAVDGAAISDETRHALIDADSDIDSPPTSHLALTRPAAGCFLSHLQIWKKFLQSGAEQLVVLEDDATPSASYSAGRADAIGSSLPPHADLVLLGCSVMGDLAENTGRGPLRRVFYFNGTYAYLLTRKGCRNLLPHLVPMRAHVDHQISAALTRFPDSLFAYAAVPAIFDHDFSTPSDAYVPLEEPEAADQELGVLIDSARTTLKNFLIEAPTDNPL